MTVQAVTVVFSELNSVRNIHSRVQQCPSEEYILQLNNLSHLNGVALQACGKLAGHFDGLLHMLGTMYWWCVAAFCSGLWNIPTPIDQVLDGHVVQMHIKIDALCEQQWVPEQHPGEKSGHCARHML